MHIFGFSVDFKNHYFKLPECWLDVENFSGSKSLSSLELKKMVMKNHFKKDVIPFNNSTPVWSGQDYVYELCFLSEYGNTWNYYIETKIENVSNIFMDTEDLLAVDNTNNYDGIMLRDFNLDNLKRSNFASKRTSIYEVKTGDINNLLLTFKNQINGTIK